MSNTLINPNKILLNAIENKNYELIYKAFSLGAPINDKTQYSNTLFLKSWHKIINLGDIGIIEKIDKAYPFKPLYYFQNLLTSVILNNKDCFDFFLKKCIDYKVNLNNKSGIILSNVCKVSPLSFYEENFEKFSTVDYYLSQLLKQNIDLNSTTKHPLVGLADNNNFHSWKFLYMHLKKQKNYDFSKEQEKIIIHSLYKFLNNNNFFSQEIQFFLNEFDKKFIFNHGLKKISHPSYKGNDLDTFCLEMFSQEPELFLEKVHTLGKNNHTFSKLINKILLFDKLESNLNVKNLKNKVLKI